MLPAWYRAVGRQGSRLEAEVRLCLWPGSARKHGGGGGDASHAIVQVSEDPAPENILILKTYDALYAWLTSYAPLVASPLPSQHGTLNLELPPF